MEAPYSERPSRVEYVRDAFGFELLSLADVVAVHTLVGG